MEMLINRRGLNKIKSNVLWPPLGDSHAQQREAADSEIEMELDSSTGNIIPIFILQ